MARNPLPIVKEFLASKELQVRKNAVAAMAAIETDEATIELVRTALKDPDPQTRQFAEQELLQLSPDSLQAAVTELEHELSDKATAAPAYALLGRIRGHGVPMALPALPWGNRLKLASSLVRQLYPSRNLAFRFRAMTKPFLVMCVAVLTYYLILVGPIQISLDPSGSVFFAVSAVFVGSVLTFLSTQRITPIGLQTDLKAGVLAQSAAIAFYSLAVMLALVGLIFLADREYLNALAVVAMLVLVPAACVLVRLVTIGAIAVTSGGWLNRYGPIIAGGCAGCVLLTVGVLNRWLYANPVIGGVWAILVPSFFGPAAGFAVIDQSGPTRRVAGRLGLAVSYVAVIVVVSAVLLAWRVSSTVTIIDSGVPTDVRSLAITGPQSFNLQLKANQIVGLGRSGSGCSAEITGSASLTPVVSIPYYGLTQKKSLSMGDYKLTVNPPPTMKQLEPASALKIFNSQITGRFRKNPPAEPICTIELTLND